MMTDPIADMLTRIRNAGQARHAEARIPASRLKLAVTRVLADAGFVGAIREETDDAGHPCFCVEIKYDEDGGALIDRLRRVSRPGRRVYVGREEVRKVRNGLGVAVISTSRGVLSDQAAREARVGGEVLCEVW